MAPLVKCAALLAFVSALVGNSVASEAQIERLLRNIYPKADGRIRSIYPNADVLIRKVYPIGDLPVMTIKGDFNAAILVTCIESSVDPDSWMSSGKGNGELQSFPDKLSLVVSQTEANHKKIATLMERLRSEAKR